VCAEGCGCAAGLYEGACAEEREHKGGVRGVACVVWRASCGVRRVACVVWRASCGVRRVACAYDGVCVGEELDQFGRVLPKRLIRKQLDSSHQVELTHTTRLTKLMQHLARVVAEGVRRGGVGPRTDAFEGAERSGAHVGMYGVAEEAEESRGVGGEGGWRELA
jgi:hypothetical protein